MVSEAEQLIYYRQCTEDDLPFVYSTWLKGLYHGAAYTDLIDRNLYFKKYSIAIKNILYQSNVTIACLEDSPDVIIGYAVRAADTLHWVYVKKMWRRQGIATRLTFGISKCTHLTDMGASILRKNNKIKYNPFGD